MPHASRWIGTVLLVAGLGGLAACAAPTTQAPGTPGPTTASPSASATPTPTSGPTTATTTNPPPVTGGGALGRVTVSRSGGIAGVMQTVRLEADGSWTYTDRRKGNSRSGRLTDGQRQQLLGLLAAPGFAREARMNPAGGCADAFVYAIQVGDVVARFDDCGTTNQQPTLAAIIDLVVDATAL